MHNSFDDDPDFPSQNSLTDPNPQVLTKISNFLEMKNIFISEFWQSNRNYASVQDLQKFCQLCGLKLGVHDQISLKNELFMEREVVSIYEFCDVVPHWRRKGGDMIADFLKQRSEQLVQNLNTKVKNQRIKSSSGSYTRPQSVNLSTQTKKTRQNSASKQSLKPYRPNNSKKYLEQTRLKNLQKQEQLAQTIEKTKNEHQYNMLMKMNELNQYHHKNKSSTTYRAYKNAEGIIKVRVFDLETFKKQLTIQEFQSEYKIYNKSTKQNKCWQRPKSMKMTGSGFQQLMNRTVQTTTQSKNQKKEERQQELKNLLMNTVGLTRLLEEQIKIFKMKGIYGCQKCQKL